MTRTLAQFQQQALAFMAAGGRTIYGDPPGSRKTATSLRHAAGRPGRTLIVTPANVLAHWVEEAAVEVPEYPVAMYRGSHTAKQRTAAIESWLTNGGALLTNYEAVRRDVDWLKRAKPATMILDEAHRVKNRSSQVHRAISLLATRVNGLVSATGTPLMNRAEELWALLHLVNHHRYPSYWRWVEEHFYVQSTTFRGRTRFPVRLVGNLRPGHDALLREELAAVLLFRTVEEIMPELGEAPVWTNMPIPLRPAERRLYDQLVKHNWVEAANDEGFVHAEGLALQTRLRQLVSGWAEVSPDGALSSKAQAAHDFALDLDEPAVLFTAMTETATRLAAKLHQSAPTVLHTGKVAERDENARLFSEGKAKYIVGTLASLGVGVDGLQRNGRHAIFVDLDWVYDVNVQAVGRLRRSGQTKPVNVWTFTAEDTIDQVVAEANKAQKDMKDILLGHAWQDLVRGRL